MRSPIGFTVVAGTALLIAAGWSWSQSTRRDEVTLTNGERLTGKVLSESWKGLELDRDLDGQTDTTYPLKDVKQAVYGEQPRYMLDATLLQSNPEKSQEYIDALRRAYVDRVSSKWILQHAYYGIARRYEELAATDEKYVPMALEAYEKLLTDIPDTRYVVQVRTNLGQLFLYRGEMDKARQMLSALLGRGFGDGVEAEVRMLQAQTYLLDNRIDEADKLLDQINADRLADGAAKQRLAVLAADVQVARHEYEPAFDALAKVLSQNPDKRICAESYAVLGDLFRLRGRYEEALLAYLRVRFVYGEAEPSTGVAPAEPATQARALVGATQCFRKLNRTEDAGKFRDEVKERFPGSVWETRVKE